MKLFIAVSVTCSLLTLAGPQAPSGDAVALLQEDLKKIPSIQNPNKPINSDAALASGGNGKLTPAVSQTTNSSQIQSLL